MKHQPSKAEPDHLTEGEQRPATETVENHIRIAIYQHQLLPGTKLGENALGELFGVSRTLIKRALTSLSKEGLITMKHGRSAYIAKPSTPEAAETFEMRRLLEREALRRLIDTLSDEKVKLLRAHIHCEHDAKHTNHLSKGYALRNDFHHMIVDLAEHKMLAELLHVVLGRSKLIVILYGTDKTPVCTQGDHEALVDQIELRNTENAIDLMDIHLQTLQGSLNLDHDKSTISDLQNLMNISPSR